MSKYHYRLGAMIRVGGKYLLIRSLNSDDTYASGYHLPGRPYSEGNKERCLKKYLSAYYDADVILYGSLSPIIKKGDYLVPFLAEEALPLHFQDERVEYGYYSLAEMKNIHVEAADRLACEKAECFLPLLEGRARASALSPAEIDKINKMLDSLRYFSATIPSHERKQFLALVNSEVPYSGILKAYRFLLEQYDLSYFEFADRPKRR